MFSNRLMLVGAAALLTAGSATADMMDRPVGIRIGQRMTLKPYLSLSASYDSNVEGRSDGAEDIIWVVNPGLSLEYRSESWLLGANVWYNYNGCCKDSTSASENSYHSYGEDLTARWTDSLPGEKGWGLMFSEKFQFINQLENVMDTAGHEYGRDRQEFKLAASVQRRFNERFHSDLNANCYWLDYNNDNNQGTQYGLYGWQRWGVGLETGYAFSQWTDLLLAGSYQSYDQQNRDNIAYYDHPDYGLSSRSTGWTAQFGLGSFATDKLTYRVLIGWSNYQYDEGGENSDGCTYTVSANWIISQTWKTMILATSYYQPNEREFGSSTRVDAISWGLSHSMVQGKLQGTFDLGYRREGRECAAVSSYDYDLDIFSARLGLTYIMNRYLQIYSNLEYRMQKPEQDSSVKGNYYEYDRFRATLGLRLTY